MPPTAWSRRRCSSVAPPGASARPEAFPRPGVQTPATRPAAPRCVPYQTAPHADPGAFRPTDVHPDKSATGVARFRSGIRTGYARLPLTPAHQDCEATRAGLATTEGNENHER